MAAYIYNVIQMTGHAMKIGRLLQFTHTGASKLGNTMNAMDFGAIVTRELTFTLAGFKIGILPSFVSMSGFPFSNTVWL